MDLTIRRKLGEEYKRTLREVSEAKTGSDEAKWALEKLSELHRQMTEDRMNDNKRYTEMQKLALEEREIVLKEQQAKESKLWTVIKIVMDGAAIVLPVWASWIWMSRGLRFEETGTFTSRTGNWMSNHLRLFKK